MKHVTETIEVVYKMFEPGELVVTYSDRGVLKQNMVHHVTKCHAPALPSEIHSTVFVQGCQLGASGEYLTPITIRELWDQLGDVPVDGDDCIDESFYQFEIGTHREEIWHWFKEELGASVADLMNL